MAADLQWRRELPADRVSTLAIALTITLFLVVATWQLLSNGWIAAAAGTAPLCAVVTALLRHRPGTRTWTTLCAVPYLCFGTMELIANPAMRGWAAACVTLAFAQFAVLALLLRIQRPTT